MKLTHHTVCIPAITVVILLHVIVWAGTQNQDADVKRHEGAEWLVPHLVTAVRKDLMLEDYQDYRKDFASESLYLRISAASYILELLLIDESYETIEYNRSPGAHDLNTLAGRAAMLLEEAFDITIPLLTSQSTDHERQLAYDAAALQIDAYVRGVNFIIAKHQIGRDHALLRNRYQGKIQEGTGEESGARLHSSGFRPMRTMLDEWYPLNKSFVHLESIVGREAKFFTYFQRTQVDSRPQSGVFSYVFDNGYNGIVFYFLVEKGVILKVAEHY